MSKKEIDRERERERARERKKQKKEREKERAKGRTILIDRVGELKIVKHFNSLSKFLPKSF